LPTYGESVIAERDHTAIGQIVVIVPMSAGEPFAMKQLGQWPTP